MRCGVSKATYAIIGSHPVLGNGVIYWNDQELDAYRECRNINRDGGSVRVKKVLDGKIVGLSYDKLQDEILNALAC